MTVLVPGLSGPCQYQSWKEPRWTSQWVHTCGWTGAQRSHSQWQDWSPYNHSVHPLLCVQHGANGCHDLQQPVYAFLEIRTWVNQQRCRDSCRGPKGLMDRVFPSSLPDPTSRKGTWGSHDGCRGPGRSDSSKSAPQSHPAPGCPGGLKLSLILEDDSALKLLPLTLVLMRPLN